MWQRKKGSMELPPRRAREEEDVSSNHAILLDMGHVLRFDKFAMPPTFLWFLVITEETWW